MQENQIAHRPEPAVDRDSDVAQILAGIDDQKIAADQEARRERELRHAVLGSREDLMRQHSKDARRGVASDVGQSADMTNVILRVVSC